MEQTQEERNEAIQNQLERLTKQNQELKLQCATYEADLSRLRSDERSKKEFMDKVDDLSHRICRIIEEKKKEEMKHTESQQMDRCYFNQKVLELSADLQVANESINDLKMIIHQQDQENKYSICKLNGDIENIKSAERNALTAAGNYFHTYFPSIKSLQEHCESNPVVQRPKPKPKPFNPNEDCEILHQKDVKKMKKQTTIINSLKCKVDELQESVVNLEELNQTLEKDKKHLKKELSQAKVNLSDCQKRLSKEDETKCLKIQLEKANLKIQELESELQNHLVESAEKDAEHRSEIAQIQLKVEIEAEKSQKADELKQKVKEQKELLENQKELLESQKDNIQSTETKLNQLTDLQSEQVVQIAKLQAENEKKAEKIKDLKEKIKAMKDIPAKIEVQPEIHWDQISSPEIPKEIHNSMSEIMENKLIKVESKMKLAIKTLCAYYNAKQQNLDQFYSKYKTKYGKYQNSLASFMSEIGIITLNRAVSFNELYESLSLQNDVLSTIKKYVTRIKELETHVKKVESNYPYDALSSLKVDLKGKMFELDEVKAKNKQLKKQMVRRQCSLSFNNFEIFTSENDSTVLHNKIKEQAAQLNEIEYKIAIANNDKSSAEKNLNVEKKKANDTQSKLFICQKEIEKLKHVISEKEIVITDLQTKIRNKSLEELNNRVQKADNEKEFLINEITNIRNEHLSKAEYENTIHNLQVKVQLLEKELKETQNGKSGINQLNEQLRKSEHERSIVRDEIQILRNQGSIVVPPDVKSVEDKKLDIINSLKEELALSQKRCLKLERRLIKVQQMIPDQDPIEKAAKKISELERTISNLENQIEDEKKSYINQLKEARLEKIKEYQALVDQLKNRCETQNNVIQSLSSKLNGHHI